MPPYLLGDVLVLFVVVNVVPTICPSHHVSCLLVSVSQDHKIGAYQKMSEPEVSLFFSDKRLDNHPKIERIILDLALSGLEAFVRWNN